MIEQRLPAIFNEIAKLFGGGLDPSQVLRSTAFISFAPRVAKNLRERVSPHLVHRDNIYSAPCRENSGGIRA